MFGIWTIAAAIISFTITAILGKWLIPVLKRLKYGQTIREEGPSWHKSKEGTPTMGGIMFILGILVSVMICVPLYYVISGNLGINVRETQLISVKIVAGMAMAFLFGMVGSLDDYIKVTKKHNLGLTAIQKLILQFIIAIGYLCSIYMAKVSMNSKFITSVVIPFVGSIDLGIFYFIISALLIVGMVNAVNLTDGIDGICASSVFFTAISLMVISGILSMHGFSIISSALAGGCLGFLLWNFNPAKVFMGDTGSLFLGGMICAILFGLDMPILLIPIGIVYIVEMASVILQVVYFKITKGKRLFKMSPIHHHFELMGMSESSLCFWFSIASLIGGVISFMLVFAT